MDDIIQSPVGIVLIVYSLILLVVFARLVIGLRKVKRSGDERQISFFYRASFDGMLGGILGYLVMILLKILVKLGVPPIYLTWFPSPVVIAVVVMYISYRFRERD